MWATIPAELQKRNIDCVLNVASIQCDANRGQYALKSWLVLDLEDSPEHAQTFVDLLPKAVKFIDECLAANHRVLIHCVAGNSRSASVVIAWLMQRHALSFDEALTFVQSKRPSVRPNAGFASALKKN